LSLDPPILDGSRLEPLKVAIASTGDPLAPGAWSGVGPGVARGLRAHGVEVVGVDATPPGPLRLAGQGLAFARTRSRVDAHYTAAQHALRSRVAAHRLRAHGAVDGAVLLGAEFGLPAGTRFVTLSDLSLRQARATHPVFSRLSGEVFAAWEARQRAIYARALACCAASGWTATSLVEDYGLPHAKVPVVGFARNHEPPPRSGEWSPPRFLFVGREWERKNGPVVVDAFEELVAALPGARLDVVGEHPPLSQTGVTGHGPLRLDRPAEAARVAELFATATCFVMPSEVEPFGIAYAEAGAAGVPSIATAVGGAATIVTPEAGVLVAPGDRAALLAAMRRLGDPAVARAMGEAARARAELFTWEAVAGRLLRALGLAGDAGAAYL